MPLRIMQSSTLAFLSRFYLMNSAYCALCNWLVFKSSAQKRVNGALCFFALLIELTCTFKLSMEFMLLRTINGALYYYESFMLLHTSAVLSSSVFISARLLLSFSLFMPSFSLFMPCPTTLDRILFPYTPPLCRSPPLPVVLLVS